jgi:hypothetical protein
MKTVTLTATWTTTHEIEVDDDFVDTGLMSDFPDGSFEQVTSQTAELTDWTTR